MSARSPSATWASTSPVAGLRLGKVLPDTASTHFPSISIRFSVPSRNAGRAPVIVPVVIVVIRALLLRLSSVGDCGQLELSREAPSRIADCRDGMLLDRFLPGQTLFQAMRSSPALPAKLGVLVKRLTPDSGRQIDAEGVGRMNLAQAGYHQRAPPVVTEACFVGIRREAVSSQVRV